MEEISKDFNEVINFVMTKIKNGSADFGLYWQRTASDFFITGGPKGIYFLALKNNEIITNYPNLKKTKYQKELELPPNLHPLFGLDYEQTLTIFQNKLIPLCDRFVEKGFASVNNNVYNIWLLDLIITISKDDVLYKFKNGFYFRLGTNAKNSCITYFKFYNFLDIFENILELSSQFPLPALQNIIQHIPEIQELKKYNSYKFIQNFSFIR